MPTPPTASRHASSSGASSFQSGFGSGMPDPSAWSEEQQLSFMNALLGGGPRSTPLPGQPALPPTSDPSDSMSSPDPLAALMASMTQPGMNSFTPPGAAGKQATTRPRSLLQKLAPLIHLVAAWALLAYFVVWREPEAYTARTHLADNGNTFWRRWADLAWREPDASWGVQAVVRSLLAHN